MKASELRIGNCVFDPAGRCIMVNENVWWNELEIRMNFNDHKPIPLTEEWLLGLGIEKYREWWIPFGRGVWYEFKGTRFVCNDESEYLFPDLDYVHQLQNLYYALTGTELEVKK